MKDSVVLNTLGIGQQDGIFFYQNEEMGFKFFKTSEKSDTFIKHPDGKEYFNDIAVYPHIVVCELVQPIYEPDDTPTKYSIYLRKERRWLVNPEIEAGLKGGNSSKSKNDEDKVSYRFFDIIEVNETYLHIACQGNGAENRVYVFKNKHWIEVPYSDTGTKFPITSFAKVTIGILDNKDCIILKRDGQMNPYSLYFLDVGEYFKVPNSPDFQPKYKGHCVIFNKIFERYVVIAVGKGIGTRPEAYYVWILEKKEYLPALIDGDKFVEYQLRFSSNCFTEDFIPVLQTTCWIPPESDRSEGRFTMISTQTWQSVEVEFTYTEKEKNFIRPEVVDGKMVFKTQGPRFLEKTLD